MQTQVATRFETGTFRILLAATMIALMPAAAWPATPQDEARPRWFGDRFDSMTILAYGIPDSDYVALSFGCEPGAAVSVGVQDEASDAKEGELLSVHLASGGKRIEFSGKATLNHDSGGIELHASLPLGDRSEEHTSELQSLMRISYAVFCLKKQTTNTRQRQHN